MPALKFSTRAMHIHGKAIRRRIHPSNRDFRRLGLQKLGRALHRRIHLFGLRLRRQFIAMILQHSFHDEIRSDKYVPVHALARRAVHRRHRYCLIHDRHMAVLAGLLGRIVAVLPLLERHLLRELRQLLTLRPKCRSVQRSGNSRRGPASRMWSPLVGEVCRRRGVHHGLVPFVDVSSEGSILRAAGRSRTGFAITTFPTKVVSVP